MLWRNRQYHPIRRLGQGFQADVWLARDLSDDRLVTIKALHADTNTNSKAVGHMMDERRCVELLARELKSIREQDAGIVRFCPYRFGASALRVPYLRTTFRESKQTTADSLAAFAAMQDRASHDHIQSPTGSECGEETPDEGVFFFVFDFIPGAPLHKHVAIEGGLTEQRARFHAAELIRIIGALHERGFVYRDIKASNIIIGNDGRLSLIDFGFTKNIGIRGRTYSFCGTLHGMAPEVFDQQQRELLSEKMLLSVSNNDLFGISGQHHSVETGTETTTGAGLVSVEESHDLDSPDIKDLEDSIDLSPELVSCSPSLPARNAFEPAPRTWSSPVLKQTPFRQRLSSFFSLGQAASVAPPIAEGSPMSEPQRQWQETGYNHQMSDWSSTLSPRSRVPGFYKTPQMKPLPTSKSRPVLSRLLPPIDPLKMSSSTPSLFLNPASGYGLEVDWWSLGVLIYEMLYGKPPFGYKDYEIDKTKTIEQLARLSPIPLKFPRTKHGPLSETCKELITALLHADPTKRLGMKQGTQSIMAHPWFKDFPWTSLDSDETAGPEVHQFAMEDF